MLRENPDRSYWQSSDTISRDALFVLGNYNRNILKIRSKKKSHDPVIVSSFYASDDPPSEKRSSSLEDEAESSATKRFSSSRISSEVLSSESEPASVRKLRMGTRMGTSIENFIISDASDAQPVKPSRVRTLIRRSERQDSELSDFLNSERRSPEKLMNEVHVPNPRSTGRDSTTSTLIHVENETDPKQKVMNIRSRHYRQDSRPKSFSEKIRPMLAQPLSSRTSTKYPNPCPLCGSISGSVTMENLEIWAAGAIDPDLHFSSQPGMEAFAILEKFMKDKKHQ